MRKSLLFLPFVCLTAFSAGQSLAVPMLTIDTLDRVSAGSNFEVTIGISGMDSGVDLGAFSFDFYFTPKDRAHFLTSNFGDQLGNPLDPTETVLGLDIFDVGNSKKIEVFEASLLWDLSWQADDFDLITFRLYTPRFIDPQNRSLFVFANNFVLSDALGNQIFASNTQARKRITVVPEPATLSLVVLGLLSIGLASRGRRRLPDNI